MAKHFEELWNESEKIALCAFVDEHIDKVAHEAGALLQHFPYIDKSKKEEKLGEILFRLCWLTNKYKLNSFSSLRDKLNDYKIDVYEPDVTSE